MNKNEAISHLTQLYSGYEWFDHVDVDKRNRYVVYVKFMNLETMTVVQKELDGKHVLVEWATSKPDYVKAKYGKVSTLSELRPYVPSVSQFIVTAKQAGQDSLGIESNFTVDEVDVDDVICELDRLERICGSKILQDIFYEIHDGPNAVTDRGSQYPIVKESLAALYDKVGFDVIYEELDG
jgi:hypothetical protein